MRACPVCKCVWIYVAVRIDTCVYEYVCKHVMYVYVCMRECFFVALSVSVGDRRSEGAGVTLLSAHKKTSGRTAVRGVFGSCLDTC